MGGWVSVYLVSVEPEQPGPDSGYSERGVTVDRVVSALDRLWAGDPDMQVIWPEQTKLALVEWYRREHPEQPSSSAAECQPILLTDLSLS